MPSSREWEPGTVTPHGASLPDPVPASLYSRFPMQGTPFAHAYDQTLPETAMSSFGTYLVGFIILIIGLGIAAYLLNVPPVWILVGVVALLGIGILMATSRTKRRDPPAV